MSENIYRRARLPLYYPLVFALNMLLVVALEVLLLYRTPVPLTLDTLTAADPSYAGATLQNSTECATIRWYLAETQTGEIHLVPVRKHIMFQDRGKLLDDQITVIPADTVHMEVTTRAGIGGATVMVGSEVEPWGDEQSDYPLQMRSKYSRNATGSAGGYAAGGYFLLAALLSILESLLWNKIKHG